jgi:hypothetical protein
VPSQTTSYAEGARVRGTVSDEAGCRPASPRRTVVQALLAALVVLIVVVAPAIVHAIQEDPGMPLAKAAVFTGPVAYDLKSLRSTRFVIRLTAPCTARLTVYGARSDGGDLVLANRRITATGTDVTVCSWNGLNEKGERIRHSANYQWQLDDPVTHAMGSGGYILVCRVLAGIAGTSTAGATNTYRTYLVPGSVTCYVNAWALVVPPLDTLSARLTGPNAFALPTTNLALTPPEIERTLYFRGAQAVKSSGIYTMSVAAKRGAYYRMTIMQ